MITLFFALFALQGPGQAPPVPPPGFEEARRVIAQGNVDWGRARVAHDRQHFEKMLAPDFFVKLPDRRLTRQEFIDQISATNGPVRLTRFDASVLTVTPEGDGWSAIIQEKLEYERPIDGGGVEKAYALWITRDGWHLAAGEWKILYSEALGSQLWRGGSRPPFKDW